MNVVIRSSNERTINFCKELIHEENGQLNIHLITEVPFEAAVRKCYQIGIECNDEWLISIDADILPKQGVLKELNSQLLSMNDNVIMFNGVVYDKFLMKYRSGGIKVYRCKYLEEAIKYIPPDGTQIRPEAYTLNQIVKKKGLKKHYTNIVTGIHDYEQYYRDIYRTCFVHAVKHPEVLSLFNEWKKLSEYDLDYKIAIKGASDGFLNSDVAKIDTRVFESRSIQVIQELGLKEKNPINLEKINTASIVQDILNDTGPYYGDTFRSKLKREIHHRGMINGIQYSGGRLLEKIGSKIKLAAK